MNAKFLLVLIAAYQRIVGEIGKRIREFVGHRAGQWQFKQKVRYRFGRKPCEPLQQKAAGRGELIDGCLPGHRDSARISHNSFV